MADNEKELIIQPRMQGRRQLEKFLVQLESEGVHTVYLDPKKARAATKKRLRTMHTSQDSDYVVLGDGRSSVDAAGSPGGGAPPRRRQQKVGRRFKVKSNSDIDGVMAEAEKGLDFVIIEVRDWKIIPLENVIAKLHKLHTRIMAVARTPEEVRKMFSILDVGVDGVIFAASSMTQVRETMLYMGATQFEMAAARVTEIREVGDGERVCVDTASMLSRGEGMLIGSRSNFMFLVHNESVGSSFTSPRPFRVNAGAVHCYTPAPDGTTRYLSEIETGSEVLVLTPDGKARRAAVGRSKIERRPMLMIKASVGGETGGIIAQDAETIRFVRPDGSLVSVTHLKEGDTVVVHAREAAGRHFGMEVSDEYILEK